MIGRIMDNVNKNHRKKAESLFSEIHSLTGMRLIMAAVHAPLQRKYVAEAGSSQRMMQGLTLPSSMEIGPLFPGYIKEAPGLGSESRAIESYAVWGGMPRHWELSEEFGDDLIQAIDRNVQDPRGPLHSEPETSA